MPVLVMLLAAIAGCATNAGADSVARVGRVQRYSLYQYEASR